MSVEPGDYTYFADMQVRCLGVSWLWVGGYAEGPATTPAVQPAMQVRVLLQLMVSS